MPRADSSSTNGKSVDGHRSAHLPVSAVICTYERSDLLPVAIQSLLEQSLAPDCFEIIVVGNDSRDSTADAVRPYLRDGHPRVRYVQERQRGLSRARNTGVRLASSDIVAFLDDDAVADPDWLAALLAVYDVVPDAWAVGGKVLPLWQAERPGWLEDGMLRSLSIVDWGDKARALSWPERLIGTNFSFRKAVFSTVGQFATDLGRKGTLLMGNEDTEIQERIHWRGKLVMYTPEAVVHHHVPKERMTRRYFFRRAYGTGRSEAILSARNSGGLELLRHALGRFLKFPWRCLRGVPAALRSKDARFVWLVRRAQEAGFLRQAMELVLVKRGQVASPPWTDTSSLGGGMA